MGLNRSLTLYKTEIKKRYRSSLTAWKVDYTLDFIVNGTISALTRWIREEDTKHSLDELAALMMDIVNNGKKYLAGWT